MFLYNLNGDEIKNKWCQVVVKHISAMSDFNSRTFVVNYMFYKQCWISRQKLTTAMKMVTI